MTESELEEYLHRHIPLSLAMEVSVREASPDHVVLGAPIAPNINHRDTVFGGSAVAVAILAAWSLLHLRMLADGLPARIVIQRCDMRYERPITGAFTARSFFTDPGRRDAFLTLFARRGRSRIGVSAALEQDGKRAGRFDGRFVASSADQVENA